MCMWMRFEGNALGRPRAGEENPSIHGHRPVALAGRPRVAHHSPPARLPSLGAWGVMLERPGSYFGYILSRFTYYHRVEPIQEDALPVTEAEKSSLMLVLIECFGFFSLHSQVK